MTLHLFSLDDERLDLESIERHASKLGLEFHGHTAPQPFQDAVLAHQAPAILTVDHDLGGTHGLQGYDVVRVIREKHPYGLVLPILYFSARQTVVEFSEQETVDLALSPTALIPKFTDNPLALRNAIAQASEMLDQVLTIASYQATEQAYLAPELEDGGIPLDEEDDSGDGEAE